MNNDTRFQPPVEPDPDKEPFVFDEFGEFDDIEEFEEIFDFEPSESAEDPVIIPSPADGEDLPEWVYRGEPKPKPAQRPERQSPAPAGASTPPPADVADDESVFERIPPADLDLAAETRPKPADQAPPATVRPPAPVPQPALPPAAANQAVPRAVPQDDVDDDRPDWMHSISPEDDEPLEEVAAPPESAPVAPPTSDSAADIPVEEVTPHAGGDTPVPPGEEPAWFQALRGLEPESGDETIETPAWLQAMISVKETTHETTESKPSAVTSLPKADTDPLLIVDETAYEAARAEKVQQSRERRAQRRRERRTNARHSSSFSNAIQALIMVAVAAVLIATIFTFWTPANFLSDETREGLRPAYATLSAQSPPTLVPTPVWMRRIGIVSGHWGPHPSTGRSDPGAVCADGLTEAQINRNVAQLVVQALSGRGYDVDLLDEWDPRLDGYQASALVSIHADSCHHFEQPGATGFKVAPPSGRTSARADDMRLYECMIRHYGEITDLPLHPSLTRDMTEYHSFQEISPVTPAGIIELGFLYEDRAILENNPEILAEGIVAGILCFLENAPPTPLPELTPWPTLEATPTPLETPGLS